MPHIALVLEGEFWEVPVILTLVKGQEFDRGSLIINKGGTLDLTRETKKLLGGDGFELELPADLAIHYFGKEKDSRRYTAIGASLGGLDFQYVKGTTEGNKAFIINLNLGKLLEALPGLPQNSIKGQVYAGKSKGKVYAFVQNKDGIWQSKVLNNGMFYGGNVQLGEHSFSLEPAEESDVGPEVDLNGAERESVRGDSPGEMSWLDLKSKKVGPLVLHQLGFLLNDGSITVLIRAELLVGGFSLALLGTGVEVELSKLRKEPLKAFDFKMLGLGLAYRGKSFEIAGMFEKLPTPEPQYAGGVLLRTKAFSITGFGAYADMGGYKSVFGYLSINANLGGPPSFFILGMVICFGYNRQLKIPALKDLNRFPLVRNAIDSSSGPKFGKAKGGNPIVQFNQQLGQYIPPKQDHFFFGVGVKFSTFRVVNTVALLTISQRDDLEFSLLGISRLILPPGIKGAALVFVEIVLRGTYSVNKGVLEIEGRISSQSYVFSQSVKLTGGFAFYAWFKDQGTAKAGDFVITVGGYHPKFKPPAHYPVVPRLGFEWKIGNSLTVSGSMYMAITPVVIMAGGTFQAIYQSGKLTAEFMFSADFLISWKPFYYEAEIHISLRIGYYVNLFLVKGTISLQLGAHLHVWGPDFSGRAQLNFRVCGVGFSVGMTFGSAEREPSKLSWQAFKESFLSKGLTTGAPKNTGSKLLSVMAIGGLIEEIEDSETIWLMNPGEFHIGIESVIPIVTVKLNNDQIIKAPKGEYYVPLCELENEIASELTVEVVLDGASTPLKLEDSGIYKNMPRAIWNDKHEMSHEDRMGKDATLKRLMGINLKPKRSKKGKKVKIPTKSLTSSGVEKRMVTCISKGPAQYDNFFIMDESHYPKENFPQLKSERQNANTQAWF